MALETDGAGVEGASCEEGALILKMLQDSGAPYFQKDDHRFDAAKIPGIPKEFSCTYVDMFQTPELYFTGPSGHPWPVMLKVRSRLQKTDIIYLNRGWLDFVHENGFQAGDHLLFWMVKKATFRVFLCSQATLLGESGSDNKSTVRSGISSEGAEYPKVYDRRAKPGGGVLKRAMPEEAEVEAGKKSSEQELVKHPNLITVRPIFPHFFRMLSGISLPGTHDIHLELPSAFVQEHGHKFSAHVYLLGPSGRARLVNLRLRSNGEGCRSRVQIREGWKSFALENGLKLGDSLLFSLVAFSKFICLDASPLSRPLETGFNLGDLLLYSLVGNQSSLLLSRRSCKPDPMSFLAYSNVA